MKELTEATFDEVTLTSDVPVLVDFWASWCGPCKKLTPILEDIAEELGDSAIVASVNVDEERGLAMQHQIMAVPTVMLFAGGRKVEEFSGVRPAPQILALVDNYAN
ncbi:thioredoxin [Corynebacterium pyruviciproducens]|uniref:thioredoxin n=1 Tax=Corynebacterium pyruviciproducens TaxID=598660 RepID=UPI00254D0177|nr:thioredoxin [Corynebacterium pyruviciproducens]MDK6566764.1 thioredoxin [Corynebacterium pyruviciproducens]